MSCEFFEKNIDSFTSVQFTSVQFSLVLMEDITLVFVYEVEDRKKSNRI